MNERYYSELDKIILRSKRKRAMQEWKEQAIDACKFITVAATFYGMLYLVWLAMCVTFPTAP